ncbi:hypothetical protein GBA52_026047 [Prunus armeniaca]|nr:hypothetical protein GBA52_026047 [Prunus armeniaca]
MWNRATFRIIMIACIIMHNMIMEDERAKDEEDLDVKEVDPMNPRKARIYERPNDDEFEIVGRGGQNLEGYMDRYVQIRSYYVHDSL